MKWLMCLASACAIMCSMSGSSADFPPQQYSCEYVLGRIAYYDAAWSAKAQEIIQLSSDRDDAKQDLANAMLDIQLYMVNNLPVPPALMASIAQYNATISNLTNQINTALSEATQLWQSREHWKQYGFQYGC